MKQIFKKTATKTKLIFGKNVLVKITQFTFLELEFTLLDQFSLNKQNSGL